MDEAYCYLLECCDGSFYCGWTNNVEKRVKSHNEGTGSAYTNSHRPVRLVHVERFATKSEAMHREWTIKHLTHDEKRRLIEEDK